MGARSFVAAGVLLVLIAVLAYQSWLRFNPGLDLNIYLEAVRAFWSGANPYAVATPAPFIYPPFVCVMLWPLAQLPLDTAAVIWFVLSIVALGSALVLVLRIGGPLDSPRALAAIAITCVLLTEVLQNNLRNAQINFLVLACTAAFAWSWSRGRRGAASCWLAVAIAVKVTPAIFLIWLARRRDWRTLVSTAAIALTLTIALPAVVAGPRILDDFRGYVQTFGGDRVTGASGVIVERRPFSVAGALHRFTDVQWPLDAVMLGLAVLLITGFVFDRGSSLKTTGHETAALISLYLAAALLATPMSEVHHLALILPGLVWLTYRALAGEVPGWRLAALAFVVASLMLRRAFHGAAFVSVTGAWLLLAAECHAINRMSPPGRASVEDDLR